MSVMPPRNPGRRWTAASSWPDGAGAPNPNSDLGGPAQIGRICPSLLIKRQTRMNPVMGAAE